MLKRFMLKRVADTNEIRQIIEQEYERTGGIFRLAPTWVGRPGIIMPGRRIKLADDYIKQDVAVNERWLCSVTYADNGTYNNICPEDHGKSYLVIGQSMIQFAHAIEVCGDLLLGKGKKWDVLPKFFDNWHRIPNHMHPCQDHCADGLTGKPESYYFPEELNMDKNAFASTPMGVDPTFTDEEILNYFEHYFKGDNQLTNLGNTINLIPGTGYFMPPCTLHAPGSLVTYELQVASDVSCIPESRVNDMVMPNDMIDRDLPVKIDRDGWDAVCKYMLSMIRCKNAGNTENFRAEYFRPPVSVFENEAGSQKFVIYRQGRASEPSNPDLYSAKKSVVHAEHQIDFCENAAFGLIALGGYGKLCVPGKQAVALESVSMFPTRDDIFGDELFVAAEAAKHFNATCTSMERLSFYQHFASESNPESSSLRIPRYLRF